MKGTKYHRVLTAKTILAKFEGGKTLLPSHCADLMMDYESSYGMDCVNRLTADYGQKIAGVVLDLARTHVSNPGMNDKLLNAMLKAA